MPAAIAWQAVTYGGGQFVAVAASSTAVATSPDGITWTQRNLPDNAQWSAVTWGGGMFVALASSSAIASTSPDGITWTPRTLPASAAWSSVAYGNGIFLAVANAVNSGAFSRDGINWSPSLQPVALTNICFGNGFFIGMGGANAAKTDNGSTWSYVTPSPPSLSYAATAFGAGVIIGVASGTASAARASVISPTNFNLPLVKPGDGRSTAYIKVA